MAMDRIAAAEAGAVAEIREAAASIATAAARSVIAQQVDSDADEVLINTSISELPKRLRA
jgi:F-type H+-transporting ATPase subunit b